MLDPARGSLGAPQDKLHGLSSLEDRSRRLRLQWMLGVVLFVVAVGYLVNAWLGREIDFVVYRAGGAAVLAGRSLYGQQFNGMGLPFTYPPVTAICFTVLSWLSIRLAQEAWTLASLFALWAYVRLVVGFGRATLPAFTAPVVLGITVLMAVSDPGGKTLSFGQINLFLALMVMADLAGALPRVPRGVFIGLAAALKLTPLFLIPVLFATRRTRAGINAAATFVAVSLLAALLDPSQSTLYWLHGDFAHARRVGNVAYLSNQSLYGFIGRVWGTSGAAQWTWLILAGTVGIGIMMLCRRLELTRPGLANGVALMGMLFVSPVSWVHHWVFALPFVYEMWRLALEKAISPGARRVLLVLVGSLTLVLLSGAIWIAPHGSTANYRVNVPMILLGNSQILLALIAVCAVAGAMIHLPEVRVDSTGARTTPIR